MWHRAESAARASQAKHVPAFVLCAPSQLKARSFRRVLISQLNLCVLFFQGEKGGGFGVFSFSERRFSCHHLALSPQESKLSRVPPEPYGSPHPVPLSPALITHYWDLTNPLLAMFCVIFWSARLSRCCDCKIQTVGLLKAERETGTRRARERKKLWAHLQRNKTFRSHKQTSTCSISAFVLFVNN